MEASRELSVPGYNLEREDVKELINTEDVSIIEVVQDEDFAERIGEPADEVEKCNSTPQQLASMLAFDDNVKVLPAENDSNDS